MDSSWRKFNWINFEENWDEVFRNIFFQNEIYSVEKMITAENEDAWVGEWFSLEFSSTLFVHKFFRFVFNQFHYFQFTHKLFFARFN